MTMDSGEARARDTADEVARRSYGKLIAFLAVIEQVETELSFHHNLILAKKVSLQAP